MVEPTDTDLASDITKAYNEPKRAVRIAMNTKFSLVAIGMQKYVTLVFYDPIHLLIFQ